MSLFTKATKAQAKARVAISGPSGSGKTYWALEWAKVLADGGEVAVIDTERGSASLYADQFDFHAFNMSPPYHPERLIEALRDAEENNFRAVIIDSLSHFWNGQGGVLELVDEAKARFKGNSHAAWQVGTPLQQRMIDAILAFDGHVIATMRAKTEWSMETDDRGRVTPVKVGLAPQQRDGVEYEFTLMLDVDINHRASVSKTRAELLADRTFAPNEAQESAHLFQGWLNSGVALIDRNERDRIMQAIASLDKMRVDDLRRAWTAAGLPKPALLTAAQVDLADSLIEEHASPGADMLEEFYAGSGAV